MMYLGNPEIERRERMGWMRCWHEELRRWEWRYVAIGGKLVHMEDDGNCEVSGEFIDYTYKVKCVICGKEFEVSV